MGQPAGRFEGKVVFVTGAARGQGRSHAVRFAEQGADLLLLDICADIASAPYGQPDRSDLEETVRLVEKTGRRAVAHVADVRDAPAVRAAVADGVDQLGRLDVLVANAGIISIKPALEITELDWSEVVGTNLTGTWNTVSASLPALLESAPGSNIVIISSAAGLKGPPNMAHYAAAKTGLVGLMKSLANELGPQGVRVNTVHPTTVDTEMVHWPQAYAAFRPDLEAPTRADVEPVFTSLNVLPVPWIEAADVTDAVTWLASSEARYVTGITLPVDAGTIIK